MAQFPGTLTVHVLFSGCASDHNRITKSRGHGVDITLHTRCASKTPALPPGNPVCDPVWVDGAMPGDTLQAWPTARNCCCCAV